MTRLDDAIRSLREDVGGGSPDAGTTLTQILGATRGRGSTTRVRFLALLAATFVLVGASAWAALSTRERDSHTGQGPEVSVSAPPTTSAAPTPDTLPIPVPAPLATAVPSSALPSQSERAGWGLALLRAGGAAGSQDRDARRERDGRHDEVGRAVPAWLLQAVCDAAARIVGCSGRNVEFHVSRILRAAKVSSRAELLVKILGARVVT